MVRYADRPILGGILGSIYVRIDPIHQPWPNGNNYTGHQSIQGYTVQ